MILKKLSLTRHSASSEAIDILAPLGVSKANQLVSGSQSFFANQKCVVGKVCSVYAGLDGLSKEQADSIDEYVD